MRKSASPTAMSSRMGSQTSGSRPNGPTGTVSLLVRSRAAPETRSGLTEFARRSLPAPSVATWREERFAQRVSRERFLEEDAPKVGVPVELNAEHVVGLALAPVRALPHTAERGNVRVELGAGRAQHHEDLRHGAPHEGDRTKLAAGVDAGIHRVQVAPCEGIVADEPSDLDEVEVRGVPGPSLADRLLAGLVGAELFGSDLLRRDQPSDR